MLIPVFAEELRGGDGVGEAGVMAVEEGGGGGFVVSAEVGEAIDEVG